MILTARSLLLICCTTASWAFSFGVGAQAVSHWLKAHDSSDTVIGLAHAFYYLGMAMASFAVPLLTRRLGPYRCAMIGMIASGATVVLFPWTTGAWGSCLLRFLTGCAGAISVIPLELIVSRDSAPERRTQNFGYYGFSMVLGGAVGMGVSLELYEIQPILAFCVGGLPGLTGFLLLAGFRQESAVPIEENAAAGLDLRRNFLSYGTAWCQGFLEGGMVAFLSLFLEEAFHYSKGAAGMLVGVATVGVLFLQVPVSWLADRCGKIPILLGCYAVVVICLVAIPWLESPIILAISLFWFGACSGAMYPLGLSLLGERMPESNLARAYAWFLAIECVGSVAGAAAMGKARDFWGPDAMFGVSLAAVAAVLGIWASMRFLDRPTDGAASANDDVQPRPVA